VNIVAIAPPGNCADTKPCNFDHAGNVCAINPLLSSKSTHLLALDVSWLSWSGQAQTGCRNKQFPVPKQTASCVMFVGSVLNTAPHGIRSNDIAS
jgi:hypothetical protein